MATTADEGLWRVHWRCNYGPPSHQVTQGHFTELLSKADAEEKARRFNASEELCAAVTRFMPSQLGRQIVYVPYVPTWRHTYWIEPVSTQDDLTTSKETK